MIRKGATYTLDPRMNEANAISYWLSDGKRTFVAENDGTLIGTYYLRTNQGGNGNHVCNCGYVTAEDFSGRGVARLMCEHSIEQARTEGFYAMQFNFVVSTNSRAVNLWQRLGFEIVGRLPHAFNHPTHGYVDAFVMYRFL